MSILVQGREGGRENCCNLSWYVDWSIDWCRELTCFPKARPFMPHRHWHIPVGKIIISNDFPKTKARAGSTGWVMGTLLQTEMKMATVGLFNFQYLPYR